MCMKENKSRSQPFDSNYLEGEHDFQSVPPSRIFAKVPCYDQTGKTYYYH